MVVVKEVKTRKELKKWVEFPNRLYKNCPSYVPFLFSDEMATFTHKTNPAYEFCETKLFLAYIDGKIVGRIAGLINRAYNEKWNQNAIRFTRFDFIDDYEVSKALFDKVVEYAKENGLTSIMGPIGFTDLDHEGMLVEGFDELNMSITFYNHPYYLKHMEKLGLEKQVDWVEYQLNVPQEVDPKLARLSERLITKNNFKLITYTDRKTLKKDAFEAFKVVDVAFSKLFGTVPLTDKIINKSIADYIGVVNLKYVICIRDEKDEIVGFALVVPSIAKALKKSNGKLFPFGFIRLLKALKCKNDTLEMYLVAIKPELQMRGLPAIIINHILKMCIDNKVKICETGPELENNLAVQSLWKSFDARQHKRRRCYHKDI